MNKPYKFHIHAPPELEGAQGRIMKSYERPAAVDRYLLENVKGAGADKRWVVVIYPPGAGAKITVTAEQWVLNGLSAAFRSVMVAMRNARHNQRMAEERHADILRLIEAG